MTDHEQDSGNHSFHREGESIIFNKPEDNAEANRKKHESEQHEFARSQVEANTKIATFTIWLVIATFLTIVVAVWQNCISQKAANAAQKAANTAERALTQGIESFRIDERAWVEIAPIKPSLINSDPIFGTTFACDIYPKNAGKTGATELEVHAAEVGANSTLGDNKAWVSGIQEKYLLGNFQNAPDMNLSHLSRAIPKVLAPGAQSPVPVHLICQAPKNGMTHYLVGRVDYCDQFRVRHWLKFCYFVSNAQGEIWNCQEGNEEDANPETNLDKSC